MKIVWRDFEARDLPEIRSWFLDAEVARRLSFPTDEWFAYVSAGELARAWVGLDENDRAITQVQVDRDNSGRGYLDFVIRPDIRGRGIGSAVLSAFVAGPGRAYPILEGRIEPDNRASFACCLRCGFELSEEPDEDGFIRAVHSRT